MIAFPQTPPPSVMFVLSFALHEAMIIDAKKREPPILSHVLDFEVKFFTVCSFRLIPEAVFVTIQPGDEENNFASIFVVFVDTDEFFYLF